MYRVFNDTTKMFYSEWYENYVDALYHVYCETYFRFLQRDDKTKYGNFFWWGTPTVLHIYDGNLKVDILTYEGNDGSSYYKSQIKGCWVHNIIYQRDIRWEQRKNEDLRKKGYKYRSGPVPGTGHRHFRMRASIRHMRTTQERRMNSDPEVLPYVRGRRHPQVIPNSYDDFWTSRPKNWKHQTKVKHQYMKHWGRENAS